MQPLNHRNDKPKNPVIKTEVLEVTGQPVSGDAKCNVPPGGRVIGGMSGTGAKMQVSSEDGRSYKGAMTRTKVITNYFT